jgi:hypothetical protein
LAVRDAAGLSATRRCAAGTGRVLSEARRDAVDIGY